MSRLRAARRALRQAATLLRECSSLESHSDVGRKVLASALRDVLDVQALVDLARVSQASHLTGALKTASRTPDEFRDVLLAMARGAE